MNKPIDKSKKSNIKCEHCKHCDRSNKDYDFCTISQTKKHYWNRCKKFEWEEDD